MLGLFALYFSAVFLRLLPTIETGLMYTYDSWEDASRVIPALVSGYYPKILPHGPLFYVLMLEWCVVSGMGVFEAFLYFIPFLSALIILPVFLLTRVLTGDDRAGLYSSLFASTASFLLHWTATPVPEAVGLTYVPFIIFLLYCSISRRSLRHLLMLGVTYLAIVLTHHLTPFLFLVGLSILGVDALISRERGWGLLPLYLCLFSVPSTFFWWDWAIADWTIGVIGRILSVTSPLFVVGVALAGLFFVALFFLVDRKEFFPFSKDREYRTAGYIGGGTAVLIVTVFVLLVTQTNFNLPMEYILVYGISHMGFIYSPTWLGFILFFNRNREHWKRTFSLVWCLGTYSVDVLLAFASFWFVISYRTFSFLILVGLPLLGYGYSFLSKLGHPRWRPAQGLAIAYLAVLLVPLGFPSARLAFGSDEFYKTSEYIAAEWMADHIVGETMVDSDHRMGKLVRYVTGQFVWLGNESSWLGVVTQTGELIEIDPSIEYLVVTSTMIEYLVTDGVEQQGKPVTSPILHYLYSSPYINLVYSSDHTMILRNGRRITLSA
jgi:hypothetical protein